MRTLKLAKGCLLLCAVLAIPASAAQNGRGQQARGRQNQAEETKNGPAVSVGVEVFLDKDEALIREYVSGRTSGNLPPGLAKRGGALPPGLEKQLQKNGQLPPGLQKRLYAFPAALEERLAPLDPGLKRGFIEGRAVIYNEKTSVILDIFIPL